MSKELKAVGPYSLSLWVGNLLFVSGQLPINPETDALEEGFEDQCTRSLLNIQSILKNEGLTLKDVAKITVLMKDLEYFNKANDLFATFFDEPYPTRSTFEVSRLPKDALIEIEVIAAKGI